MQNIFSYTNSKGVVYYLNTKTVTLKSGRQQVIYYFSRDARSETGLSEVPTGMEVMETSRTKMPVLKKTA